MIILIHSKLPVAYFTIHQQRYSVSLFGAPLFFRGTGSRNNLKISVQQLKNPLSRGFAVTLQFSFSLVYPGSCYTIFCWGFFFSHFKENYSHLKPLKVGQVKCPVFVLFSSAEGLGGIRPQQHLVALVLCCNQIGPNGPLCVNSHSSSFNMHATTILTV